MFATWKIGFICLEWLILLIVDYFPSIKLHINAFFVARSNDSKTEGCPKNLEARCLTTMSISNVTIIIKSYQKATLLLTMIHTRLQLKQIKPKCIYSKCSPTSVWINRLTEWNCRLASRNKCMHVCIVNTQYCTCKNVCSLDSCVCLNDWSSCA